MRFFVIRSTQCLRCVGSSLFGSQYREHGLYWTEMSMGRIRYGRCIVDMHGGDMFSHSRGWRAGAVGALGDGEYDSCVDGHLDSRQLRFISFMFKDLHRGHRMPSKPNLNRVKISQGLKAWTGCSPSCFPCSNVKINMLITEVPSATVAALLRIISIHVLENAHWTHQQVRTARACSPGWE